MYCVQIVSHDTRRFRFQLPSPQHILGLPVGVFNCLFATFIFLYLAVFSLLQYTMQQISWMHRVVDILKLPCGINMISAIKIITVYTKNINTLDNWGLVIFLLSIILSECINNENKFKFCCYGVYSFSWTH